MKTGIDIRKHDTGNAGATNAGRLLGRKFYVLIAVIDVLKGVAAVLLGMLLAGNGADITLPFGIVTDAQSANIALAMVCVVAGHIFPAQMKFHGGQGVAATGGAILVVNPPTMLFFVAFYYLCAKTTRNKELAGLASIIVIPLAFLVFMNIFPFRANLVTFIASVLATALMLWVQFFRKEPRNMKNETVKIPVD